MQNLIKKFPHKILFIGTYAGDNYLNALRRQSFYIQLAANQTEEYYISELVNYVECIDVISALVTVPFPYVKKCYIRQRWEKYENCLIENIGFINLPVISIFFQTKAIERAVKRWIKKNKNNKEVLVLIYAMRIPYLNSVKIIKKLIPNAIVINIVPDLPMYARIGKKNIVSRFMTKFNQKITIKMQKEVDGFILYTEKMKEVLHCPSDSWIVVEGLIDKKQSTYQSKIKKDITWDKKVILYAGSLEEKYGIGLLIKGFLKAKLQNTELHLYGSGSYVNQILKYADEFFDIKYCGLVSPSIAREKMQQADLLVNPRPSNELFTQYSCPSKTLEYMSTGKPVMMTKLEGVPEEYFEYIYIIKDETIEGIATELIKFFDIPENIREERARKGQQFIYNKKDVGAQMRQVIEFARKIKNDKLRNDWM